MHGIRLLLIAVLVICGLAGFVMMVPESIPESKFRSEVSPLLQRISNSSSMTIYEGLPHQFYEPVALEKELKEQKTITIHEYPFYAEAVIASKDCEKKLRELSCNAGTFTRWQGAKACGGFHPDWLLEFKDGPELYYLQICFGCQEARLFNAAGQIDCDLSERSLRQFTTLLQPLHKNRPQRTELLIKGS